MKRRDCLLMLPVVSAGCIFRKKSKPDPPTQQDYTPPTFVIPPRNYRVDAGIPAPTRSDMEKILNLGAVLWAQHHCLKSGGSKGSDGVCRGGVWLPPNWPRGITYAAVWVRKTGANSADGPWSGDDVPWKASASNPHPSPDPHQYAMWVKGWSETNQAPTSLVFQLNAACHRMGHLISGCTGGNSCHSLMREVANC